jgi:hypothetical protein
VPVSEVPAPEFWAKIIAAEKKSAAAARLFHSVLYFLLGLFQNRNSKLGF